MFAIYKRELVSYFRSFIGFLFVAITMLFMGLYFSFINLMAGMPWFSQVIASVAVIFLISVPILTMRILAEEKRSKTDQLILTAPVSVTGIVLGKYLALLTIFLIPVAITCTFPLIMSQFGTVPMTEAYVAIFAYFLYGACMIAIGIFISSLTESQVIAAVVSFAVLFLGWMMSSITSSLPVTLGWLAKILGCYDLYIHLQDMLIGTLNVEGIIYYVSLTVLALFLTVQSIQKRRYSVSVKNLGVGAYSTGMIAVGIALTVMVNIIVGELPKSWTSIDVSVEQTYSLSDESKEYMKNMNEDVTIYMLTTEGSMDTTLQNTLTRLDEYSEHITVEYVDPTVNPTFHREYTDEAISMNSLIVVSDKRSQYVDYNDMYEVSYDYSTQTTTTSGYDGEGQTISAIDFVLADNLPKAYVSTGHGEYHFSDSYLAAIDKQNVETELINFLEYEAVPEDATCLVINAPANDISGDDKDKIIDYLERGGNVVLITSYTMEGASPNLDEVLAYMGMEVSRGLVADLNTNNYYENPYYLIPTVTSTEYTAGTSGYYVFAPFSQAVTVLDAEAEDMSYETFLSSSENSFAKSELGSLDSYNKEEGDLDGPHAIGIKAVKDLDKGKATMVVYSCEQLFTDNANAVSSGANQKIFANTMSSFGEYEVSAYVPVKKYTVSMLFVPQTDIYVWSIVTIAVLPIAFLVVGFVIWFKRRKR